MGFKGIWCVLLLVCVLLVVLGHGESCDDDDGLPCGPCVSGNCFFCANGSTEACVLSLSECPNPSVIIITPGDDFFCPPPDPTSTTTTTATTPPPIIIITTKESPFYFYFFLVLVITLSILVLLAHYLYYNAAALYSNKRAINQVTFKDSTVVLVM